MLDPGAQVLVCGLETAPPAAFLAEKWAKRAAAVFTAPFTVLNVVRDILANPQIRAIVFEGTGNERELFRQFWEGLVSFGGIHEDHLDLVRRFVDLFDEDCVFYKPKQPFWPLRLKYAET